MHWGATPRSNRKELSELEKRAKILPLARRLEVIISRDPNAECPRRGCRVEIKGKKKRIFKRVYRISGSEKILTLSRVSSVIMFIRIL
jgi:hypothetical protein